MHHGGETDMTDTDKLFSVCCFHVLRHRRVCGPQTMPNLFPGIAPQTILKMASPAIIAGGDRAIGVVDEYGLDSGGAEFDA